MPIDINGLQNSQLQTNPEGAKVQVSRGEPTKAQGETGTPSTTDTVSLTDTASRLQSLENTLASLPVSDPQRVESVRQAINEGTFKFDSVEVADKMLNFEKSLNNE